MKRFVCILALALSALPAWSAKKITVAELTDLLKTMHDQQKPDADVAAALKQVQLTELLSRDTMNSYTAYSPGPLTNEQVYVLEARSAVLPPPAADLPKTAAPDAAAQKAILDKASAYATKTWAQLPSLTATKTTLRFQDNVEATGSSSGLSGSAKEVATGSSFVNPYQFVHYINSTESLYSLDHGIEKLPEDKTKWGANRMIALQEPDPSLSTVLQDAQNGGTISWLRWEEINGKPAAVFAYQIPKKKSHLNTNVCCFPNVDQTGVARFSSAAIAGPTGGSGGASGNFQTNTEYSNHYKANGVPYHGELFVDPDTGIVVRLITQLELKQTDVVHQQDTRIDYAPAKVGDKDLVLPMKTVINTEVVPNGDSQSAGKFSTRCTLFTSEYKDFKLK
ncbi:hypothetical protein [Occallatibacter savannae]|uniref:hypothetical protein n=1 Tax=Occallatibacter savannae TaxID=1002691 RepID=UPI0013A5521D|nr:hypothetical protein [Occallatibacter savannae]